MDQEENKVTHTVMKTTIKSLYSTPHPQDNSYYHQPLRPEQVVIFRLSENRAYNQLNQHMHNRFRLVSSPPHVPPVEKQIRPHSTSSRTAGITGF